MEKRTRVDYTLVTTVADLSTKIGVYIFRKNHRSFLVLFY